MTAAELRRALAGIPDAREIVLDVNVNVEDLGAFTRKRFVVPAVAVQALDPGHNVFVIVGRGK